MRCYRLMVSAGIIGAIQIKLTWRERRDAGFDIDGSSTAESSKGVAVFPLGQMALFVMVLVLFFLWGMSNNLTDILVQQFRSRLSCRSSRRNWCRRRTLPGTSAWRFRRRW